MHTSSTELFLYVLKSSTKIPFLPFRTCSSYKETREILETPSGCVLSEDINEILGKFRVPF